jgi:hypothetical protein
MTVAAYAPPVETAANIAIVDITLAYVMRARNATRLLGTYGHSLEQETGLRKYRRAVKGRLGTAADGNPGSRPDVALQVAVAVTDHRAQTRGQA